MAISLTVTRPTRTDFASRFINDFSPRLPLVKSRLPASTSVEIFPPPPPPPPPPPARVDSPLSSLRVSTSPESDKIMSGHHRGLPPPSAMTLPDPSRPLQQYGSAISQPLGPMPTPPTQWHGQEESMRNWLVAKAEEDKRKQEEERTRQEQLKLEQRKIEQAMLRESLQSGVPPSMVPVIYAGLGGPALANVSIEMLQQHTAQMQTSQHQHQQTPSPEFRREPRLLGTAPVPAPSPRMTALAPVAGHPPSQAILASQPVDPSAYAQPPSSQPAYYAYQHSTIRPAPTSAPRSATHTSLPRLTTNEIYMPPTPYPPPNPHPGTIAQPSSQHAHQSSADAAAASPSIFFHHWVPPSDSSSKPGTSGTAAAPQTPASRGGEPTSAHPGSSHMSETDSPRKRKAPSGGSQTERLRPGSSSRLPGSSPPFSVTSSTTSRLGHTRMRSRSVASAGRPESRRDEVVPLSRLVLSRAGSEDSGMIREEDEEEGEGRKRARVEPSGEPSGGQADTPRDAPADASRKESEQRAREEREEEAGSGRLESS